MVTLSKKVCLLGDFAVGKTSLVRRFVHDTFDDKYISTIGVKVSRKTVAVRGETGVAEVTMMLWDLAGSQEFIRVQNSYLRGASGALLVADLSRPETFASLISYAGTLRDLNSEISLVILANKLDLLVSVNNGADLGIEDELEQVASDLNAPLFFTSALTGERVENAFRSLAQALVITR
ncbi:MAG: Rab family GTPase [Chloroflexota bacterium]|nr:Rab family GTPase [Chloroflexota bacterium]